MTSLRMLLPQNAPAVDSSAVGGGDTTLSEHQCQSRATLVDEIEETLVQCDLEEGHTRSHGHWHEDSHVIAQWVEYLDARVFIGAPLPRKPYQFEDDNDV